MIGRPLALLVVGVSAIALGCSVFAVTPPPPSRSPGERVTCTTDNTAPWLDTLVSAVTLGTIGMLAVTCHDAPTCPASPIHIKVGLAASLITFGGSAVWGHRSVSRCRELVGQQ